MPLKMDNFLSFAIVNGFFVGLLLSFLKFDDPAMIVAGTLVSTTGFYLIALVSVSLFVRCVNVHENVSKKNIVIVFNENMDRKKIN